VVELVLEANPAAI
jgi:ankyrin repeat protein